MAKEIEHKFLVQNYSFLNKAIEARYIKQGYLALNKNLEIRVSIRDNQFSKLCIKSANSGLIRDEYEYNIPYQDAVELYNKCETKLQKTRYIIPEENELFWEIDVIHGLDEELIIAEIETPDGKELPNKFPNFIGECVTGNPKYYNKNLAR